MQVLLLLLFLVLVSCHYLPFQYYCHLYSSMKTNSLLFVVIQSHLVSWRTKLLVLLELGERDSNGIGPALWLAFMIKCSSCLCCRFFLFLFLSHVVFVFVFFYYYKNMFLYEVALYNPSNLPFTMFPCFALTMSLSSTYHLWVPAVCITLCGT